MKSPIFVAIDTPDIARAHELASRVKDAGGGIKLGLEYFCANGPEGVRQIGSIGVPLFLDLKLHDIPNTVASAVRTLHRLEPAVLTVHAGGGRAMMEAAKQAAPPATKVVGVTVLTSLDSVDLEAVGVTSDTQEQVERLAALARSSGLDGIVCSGSEVAAAKTAWPDGFFVVPGVRPQGSATGDQKRVVTPREAIERGASILVIGRPVTGAEDPASALSEIAANL